MKGAQRHLTDSSIEQFSECGYFHLGLDFLMREPKRQAVRGGCRRPSNDYRSKLEVNPASMLRLSAFDVVKGALSSDSADGLWEMSIWKKNRSQSSISPLVLWKGGVLPHFFAGNEQAIRTFHTPLLTGQPSPFTYNSTTAQGFGTDEAIEVVLAATRS